jgi:NADH-quinone oxidoreductase subunit L
MAGEQNLDKMGGFKKSMRFTYACMLIGGLALSGIPPLSGFWSKDEILANLLALDDWHIVLAVLGYVGAFMTAVYTFRMIFRAFHGDSVEPARELEGGHLYHAPEHTNPATGEVEDTDVGFPGADHHIAEREGSMKIAMGALALLAIVGGWIQIPGVTHVLQTFLAPTFQDSPTYETLEPSELLSWIGLLVGAVLGAAGIFLAYTLYVKDAERVRVTAMRERFGGLHSFLFHKWYFDEAIDAVVVRPVAFFGRFGRDVFERVFVNGILVGGPSGVVRAGSAAVRAIQSGFLRYYAALLLAGVAALGLYFLVAAS